VGQRLVWASSRQSFCRSGFLYSISRRSELDAESNACLIATKVEFDPPFLKAALVGKKDDDRLGLHSFIPLDVVRGMFEISEAEKKRLKIGFSSW
jgi:hypothetical protein